MKKIVLLFVALALLIPAAAALADEAQVNRYVEMLRQDIRDQKEAIIREAIVFKEGEGDKAAAFWNTYREYQNDLKKITDVRLALIKDYAVNYDKMTDKKAEEIAKKVLENDKAALKLKDKYYKKFMKAMGASAANRFFQVENTLNMLIMLRINTELPLFPQRVPAK
ncbi:MAG: hypothetical protein H6Q50_785 [Deltaproteobacteria bacterium]|jgi:lipopolysaccharide export LptBFGC system permease protein LptF|nr:hypothetical protein [Deltaproteobacteria bacterium]